MRLPDDEAWHLTGVLRGGVGDLVRVINGRGAAFEAVVSDAGRHGVVVTLQGPADAAPEPRVSITLALAVLKGDRMDEVVRDAVMLGAAAIQPVVTARSEIALAALTRSRRIDRWSRVAIASAKQSFRAVVPPIHSPCTFDALAEAVTEGRLPPALILVEPGAPAVTHTLADVVRDRPPAATVLVGPEGGWTPTELDRASQIGRLVTLGGRTLRADAAPLVALAALYAVWGEL